MEERDRHSRSPFTPAHRALTVNVTTGPGWNLRPLEEDGDILEDALHPHGNDHDGNGTYDRTFLTCSEPDIPTLR